MSMKRLLPAIIIAALLCGCSNENGNNEDTVVSQSETTTVNNYILVRFWTADELLNSIFYCGKQRSMPLVLKEDEDLVLSGDVLTFPDGTSAMAETNENGEIVSLRFEAASAPADFSIYGVGFDSDPDDIQENFGLADSVYGNTDETIAYSFFGGGISELTFVYKNGFLESVYIRL